MGKQKQLAYILYDFHTGGMETSIYNVANRLKDDFNFHFIATHVKDIHNKFRELGKVVYIDNEKDLVKYYKDNKIDIVQVNIEDWYAKAAKQSGVKRIIERTDGDRNCCKSSKKYVDHVIASTRGTVFSIAKQISKDKITVVYNGVDINKFDKNGKKNRCGFSSKEIIIGRAGRLVWGKRIDLLIDALAILHKMGKKNIKLVIVGGDSKMPGAPPMMRQLKEQVKTKGLTESIVFVGDVENPTEYVNGFDIGACVSMPKNEGIPNSLLEPMAAGHPVIATIVGDILELVNKKCGVLIPHSSASHIANAVLRITSDKTNMLQMGEVSRKIIKTNFSMDNMKKQYKRIYLG